MATTHDGGHCSTRTLCRPRLISREFQMMRHTLAQFLLLAAISVPLATAQEPDDKHAAAKPHKKHPANRLAKESSPYLLLHAHNPVDWYPWGDEAFERAKKENKPIFLSIGYSSCYWCHVMERESFSDEAIAKYMNEHFINIKLDREERPDLDDIYMTSLQIYLQATGSGGGGGWPMSMFLMPDGRPFAGGTYFPARTGDGKRGLGFETVSKRVVSLFNDNKAAVDNTARMLTAEVRRVMKARPPLTVVKLDQKLAGDVVASLQRTFDPKYGGVNFNPRRATGPKFPVPPRIEYLLHVAGKDNNELAGRMAFLTLDEMLAGGIRDHLAGGFHRYSTDQKWHVPHFEKMLYDQAQLATVYTQAWRLKKKSAYRQVATETLDYVLSDLTGKQGGFYSALDAETNTIEGEYYVWDRKTIENVMGEEAALFCAAYGLDAANPFEHGFVLHLPEELSAVAAKFKIGEDKLAAKLKVLRATLLTERKKRESPLLDDKVLTSWNGLMIRALADASVAFDEPRYAAAAKKAATFLMQQLADDSGRLKRSWRNDKAKLNAYLDDYAFLIGGLLAIHKATDEEQWLAAAEKFQAKQDELFLAEKGAGYYFTSHDHEELIVRTRNANDGVIPSGNSMSVRNLVALATRTGKATYRTTAGKTLDAFSEQLKSRSGDMANMATGLFEYLAPQAQPQGSVFRSGFQSASFVVQAEKKKTDSKKPPAKKKTGPVDIHAFLSVDKLPAGGKFKVAMRVAVKKDWHINTNKPVPDYLPKTRLLIKSKLGTKLVGKKFPPVKKKKANGEESHYYDGTITVFGLVEVPKSALGKTEELTLTLEYQACNDVLKRCLQPTSVSKTGKLMVVDPSKVKQINKEKFALPKKKKPGPKPKPGAGSKRP